MKREAILDSAKKIVVGDREEDYGSPENNFKNIATLWSGYLSSKQKADVDITTTDVANLLILLKVGRNLSANGKVDNWIDIAGYAACGGELYSEQKGK